MPKSPADTALEEALAGTEKEISDEIFEKQPDENNADRHLEEMGDGPEGDHLAEEPEAEDVKVEGTDGKKETPTLDKDGKPVKVETVDEPLPKGDLSVALRAERTLRQAKDAELADTRAQLAAMNVRLDELAKPKPAQRTPAEIEADRVAAAAAIPDPIVDPAGYTAYVRRTVEEDIANRNLEMSFGAAAETHGEKFQTAYKELTGLNPADPADRATVQKIRNSPNPGAQLLRWHADRVTNREIGGDLASFRQREEERLLSDPTFLGKAIERAKTGGQQQQVRQVTRVPKSLNDARGGSSAHVDDAEMNDNSEESVSRFATSG